jgi:hypothetical protein
VRHRGHFPNEQAALKVLDLVATNSRKNRSDLVGKINGWKPILKAPTIHYSDRLNAAQTKTPIMTIYTKKLTLPFLARRTLQPETAVDLVRRPSRKRSQTAPDFAVTQTARRLRGGSSASPAVSWKSTFPGAC